MQRIHLYTEATYRPRRAEEYIGTVKQLRRKHQMTEEDCSLDDRSESRFAIRLPAKMKDVDRAKLVSAVTNQFRQRCSCEHDCCGHWHGGVRRIRFLSKRDIIVTTSYSRNV